MGIWKWIIGAVGAAITLTRPIIWAIDRVSEADFVNSHIGQIGQFLDTGWGTAVTVLLGMGMIAYAVYLALGERSAPRPAPSSNPAFVASPAIFEPRRAFSGWKSAKEAIESFAPSSLIEERDKQHENFESAYLHGKDAEDKIRAIDDQHPTMNAAPAEVVAERDRQHRLLSVHARLGDYAKEELRRAWDALRDNIEEQLKSGALIAKGFRSPHVGGNPEVDISSAEWRILALDNVKSEAVRKDRGETVYVGLVIGKAAPG